MNHNDDDAQPTFEGRPVFTVRPVSDKLDRYGHLSVTFHCPYCDTPHTHGWIPNTDPAKPSHRIAHCTRLNSPLRDGGYFIVLNAAPRTAADRDEKMPLREVPNYVELKTGHKPTLATVYNWIDRGVKGEKLRIVMARGTSRFAGVFNSTRFTRAVWVDEFLSRADVSAGR